MAAPETMCPKCALSPIPDRAEKCPRCGEIFSFNPLYKRAQKVMIDKRESLDFEATLRGALTGAVSANPGPAAAVLALGAALWLIRAAGLFVDLNEPTWLFALAAFELCAATVLMANIGPAQLLAQAVCLAHLAAAFVLGSEDPLAPHTLLSASLGLVVIGMTLGEPSKGRRTGGLALGVFCAVGAVSSLVWVTDPPPAGPVLIDDPRIGYSLKVPDGWKKLAAEELSPHLPLPSEDANNKYVGFGSRLHRTFGLLLVSADENTQLIGGCQEHLRRLGGVNDAVPLGFSAPGALGKESLMFELRTASGAVGRMGCGRVGKRFVALAVLVLDPAPAVGATAFEKVAAGLTVR